MRRASGTCRRRWPLLINWPLSVGGRWPSGSSEDNVPAWPGVIARYRAYLPVTAKTPIVTLLEGNTPLIPAPFLGERLGRGVPGFLKDEGLHPTRSVKDRGGTMAGP